MKTKTAELNGAALNWAVAKCEANPVALYSTGEIYLIDTPWKDKSRVKWIAPFTPSKSWAQGGPIIEREKIAIDFDGDDWCASTNAEPIANYGPTPLIAAMRCYVMAKLGNEVDLPEGLT